MKNLYKTTVTLPKPRYTTAVVVPEHLDYELERINQLDDTDFENYAEELRIHLLNLYEKEHFPIGTMGKTLQDIIVDLRKFNDYNTKDVLLTDKHGNENVLACFNKFSSAINNWFPEMYDTKIGSTKFSIIDQLRNKEMFRKNLNGIVRKDQFKFRINDPLAPISNYVASGFRVINGSQPAVNFPAGIAKWIYLNILSKKQFRDKKELKILDTSAGWGGRLVGLLSACNEELLHDKHITLLNTDPNSATHDRFQEIVDFWREYVAMELNFTLHKSILPSEDLLKFKYAKNNIGNFDMMLTSPPYYNREQYSNDKDQSYIKHPTYDKWRDGFLAGTLENVYKLLMPKGYCLWNIADIKVSSSKDPDKAYIRLEDDSIKIAKQLGFTHVNTYKMLVSSFVGKARVNGNQTLSKNLVEMNDKISKYEPIFVFRKD